MSIRIPVTRVNRFFNIVFGSMAMIAIAVTFAFTTMRLAIHGGQVEVPNLVGVAAGEAQKTIGDRGLNLVLINRFYSTTIPAGRIISQTPSPGVIVRHEWVVRAIESLGPQRVAIPDVSGMTERPAAMEIRKLSLDLGTVAHLPAPGEPETVLAQTPPPNAGGIDSPRVSLLLSQKDDGHASGFVMPSFVGMSMASASSRASALGLYVIVASAAPEVPPDGSTANPADGMVVGDTGGAVSSQNPAAGHRAVRGEGVRLSFGGS